MSTSTWMRLPTPQLGARALADKAVLALVGCGSVDTTKQAQRALALARELDDPACRPGP